MTYNAPIKVIPDVPDRELTKTIRKLESEGYQIQQRKRVEQWNYKTQKNEVFWNIKAKFNSPPPKAGRILVD